MTTHRVIGLFIGVLVLSCSPLPVAARGDSMSRMESAGLKRVSTERGEVYRSSDNDYFEVFRAKNGRLARLSTISPCEAKSSIAGPCDESIDVAWTWASLESLLKRIENVAQIGTLQSAGSIGVAGGGRVRYWDAYEGALVRWAGMGHDRTAAASNLVEVDVFFRVPVSGTLTGRKDGSSLPVGLSLVRLGEAWFAADSELVDVAKVGASFEGLAMGPIE